MKQKIEYKNKLIIYLFYFIIFYYLFYLILFGEGKLLLFNIIELMNEIEYEKKIIIFEIS